MWSLANEPRTQLPQAEEYFKQIAHHAKAIDPTRPVTIALARGVQVNKKRNVNKKKKIIMIAL